jgi:hypothetical protein
MPQCRYDTRYAPAVCLCPAFATLGRMQSWPCLLPVPSDSLQSCDATTRQCTDEKHCMEMVKFLSARLAPDAPGETFVKIKTLQLIIATLQCPPELRSESSKFRLCVMRIGPRLSNLQYCSASISVHRMTRGFSARVWLCVPACVNSAKVLNAQRRF